MKNKFLRLISLLLTIASLVSMLTVFAWAEEGEGAEPGADENAETINDVTLIYERDFEEGWDVDNGLAVTKNGHNIFVDYEECSDYSYNYFMRLESGGVVAGATAVLNFQTRVAQADCTVVTFRIKLDDACNFGSLVKIQTGGKTDREILLMNPDKSIHAFSAESTNKVGSLADNEWVTLTYVFDWNDRTAFNAKCYVGEDFDIDNPDAVISEKNTTDDKGQPVVDSGIRTLTFSIPSAGNEEGAKAQDGMSYCIDDLQVYQDINTVFSIDEIKTVGPGQYVDPLAPKVVDIQEGSGVKTLEELLNEALCLKLDVPYSLFKGKKLSLANYCTPTKVDGQIVVPLQLILDFIGYPYYVHTDNESYDITTGLSSTYITVGRDVANVNGEIVELSMAPGYLSGTDSLVIAMEDIPTIFSGWNLAYDDMGLIIMYEDIGKDLDINRDENLDVMLSMMKKFIFGNEDTYQATGDYVYDSVKANTEFAHPYIFADQAKFDSLKAAYAEEGRLQDYLNYIISKADGYYNDIAEDNEGEYVGIADGKEPVNVYFDGMRPTSPDDPTVDDTENAYSPNGDLYEIEQATEKLVYLAFAYQITGDVKYAKLAYDMSIVLGEWTHWAPGYMRNCANATSNFAVAYDWLYNVYVELGYDVDALAEIIYTKGVSQGYNASTGVACDFARPSGIGDVYITRTDSWNVIGASGMIIGSLAIMGVDEYKDVTTYLVGNNFHNLVQYGLDDYAPDGSYIESATYWAYSTNSLMKLIMALKSSANDDLGLTGTWGMDSTFYYAIHIENTNGDDWNYHEDGVGVLVDESVIGVDTQMFNFAAQLFGDDVLYAVRESQVDLGKEISIFDALFFEADFDREVELSLDYKMEGIEGFVSRSEWENGALYVGIMGGANYFAASDDPNVTNEQFGQVDSGNFVYSNNGVDWFIDLGSDNYALYNYFGSYRFRYYRNSADGNNVIFFTSKQTGLPYGQDINSAGTLAETYVDPDGKGSYAIIDNAAVYGSYVLSAKRGMLLFNDRKTVVIQDEISMNNSFEDLVWVAHTAQEIVLDETGKVAYLINKDSNGFVVSVLRATLVASASGLKFEVSDALTPILKTTIKNDKDEFSREGIQKLLIRATGMLGVEVAVVLEEVEDVSDTTPCAYTWVNMAKWESVFSMEEDDGSIRRRGKAVRSNIVSDTAAAEMFLDNESAYTLDFILYFETLSNVAYTLKTFPYETFGPTDTALFDAFDDYSDYSDEFNEYADYVNDTVDNVSGAMMMLMGQK